MLDVNICIHLIKNYLVRTVNRGPDARTFQW
jgi:hypothetical protein